MTLDPSLPRPPVGWPLLPVPDDRGQLAFPTLAESVRENLQVLLSTSPGEQLMRPDYGAGLGAFLGEPGDNATRRRIQELVTHAIERWEQRILLDAVEVTHTPDSPGTLRIEIRYRLRWTGDSGRLGVRIPLNS